MLEDFFSEWHFGNLVNVDAQIGQFDCVGLKIEPNLDPKLILLKQISDRIFGQGLIRDALNLNASFIIVNFTTIFFSLVFFATIEYKIYACLDLAKNLASKLLTCRIIDYLCVMLSDEDDLQIVVIFVLAVADTTLQNHARIWEGNININSRTYPENSSFFFFLCQIWLS